MQFQYYNPTRIHFGCGKRKLLAQIIRSQGWASVALVVDHGLRNLPMIAEIQAALTAAQITTVSGYCDMAEPSYLFLDKFRQGFDKAKFDAVVGIGGGSALDTAKAIAVLARNRSPAVTYRGFDRMTEPVLPVIALPTTAGTGSEVTPNASFVDTIERRKLGINGEAVRPKVAILDPEFTLSCPVRPSVSAGVDALVHATEAYVAKKTNPIARFYAREGFTRIFSNLPKMVADPQDLGVRTELLYGSHLAGVALMHSGTGPAAAMSYPLGVLHGVPHGVGGGIFLPHVVAHNVAQGYWDYADLLADGPPAPCESRRVRAERFVAEMGQVWETIGVPSSLSSQGIDATVFVEQTLLLSGALEQNPVPFGAGEIRAVLQRLHAVAA